MSYSAHLDCSRDRLLFHLMYPLGLSLRLNLHLVFNFLCIPESAGEHWLVDGSVRYIKFTIIIIIIIISCHWNALSHISISDVSFLEFFFPCIIPGVGCFYQVHVHICFFWPHPYFPHVLIFWHHGTASNYLLKRLRLLKWADISIDLLAPALQTVQSVRTYTSVRSYNQNITLGEKKPTPPANHHAIHL